MSMSAIRVFNQIDVKNLVRSSVKNPLKRSGIRLHKSSQKAHRSLHVLQPGTYVRPHLHRAIQNWNGYEMLVVLYGTIGVILFDNHGNSVKTLIASPRDNVQIIEIPPNAFHTVVALEHDTMVLEIKDVCKGKSEEFCEGFPQEGTKESRQLVKGWEREF